VSADDPRCEAVLSSSGKIHDARGPARSQSSLDVLRRAAINHEKARGALRKRDPEEALSLWHGLVAGRWSLVDSFESDGRRFLVARENSPRLARRLALTPTELRVVQLVAVGHANKLVAYELGLSTCSVAMHLRRAMAKLGLQHRSDLSRVVMRALDAEAGS
jgi:DNA-binding CsgD family transcriptional regulator